MLQKDVMMSSCIIARPLNIPHSILTLRLRVKEKEPISGISGTDPSPRDKGRVGSVLELGLRVRAKFRWMRAGGGVAMLSR